MPKINQLSQSIINKIAAGEVIERPASVAKELVENSVDAGAKRIDISVEGGGRDMIRIVDNGHGIDRDQLHLALASHATSKIQDANDLFSVATLGFRGEALASIAEISQTVLRSRTPESDEGAELRSDGGQLSEITPCGCPVGTSIEVRNLFFNTPVRRKFLKTTQTELGHLTEAVTRIAMPNPEVHFTLRHNDRSVLDLPATPSLSERIGQIVGRAIADKLIPVESEHGAVRMHGFVVHPSLSRSNTKMQYLFLNGRHIRDRQLQHALGEAFRGLLTSGRQPIAFLMLEMPPGECDVNVHPTKLEVRFQDGSRLYSQLLSTLRSKFLSTDMTVHVDSGPSDDGDPQSALDQHAAAQFRQQVIDWAKGDGQTPDTTATGAAGQGGGPADFSTEPIRQPSVASRSAAPPESSSDYAPSCNSDTDQSDTPPAAGFETGTYWDESFSGPRPHGDPSQPSQQHPGGGHFAGGPSGASHSGASHSGVGPRREPLSLHTINRGDFQPFPDLPSRTVSGQPGRDAPHPSGGPTFAQTGPTQQTVTHQPNALQPVRFMQVHNRYIVTENEHGLVVIDQHALHERILYEKMKRKIVSGEGGMVQSQQLLVPEPVDLSPTDRALALEHLPTLEKLGLKIEPFGGDTLLITAYPTLMSKMKPEALLRAVIERLAECGKAPSRAELLEELLQTMSCKAAIKAGDPLTPSEIESLLAQQQGVDDCHHCPHGRPSTLIFTPEELDKQFKRM